MRVIVCATGPQHAPHQRYRQADYVGIITLNTRDPARSHALNAVGPGFVHGVLGGDVGVDVVVGELSKLDARDLVLEVFAAVGNDADGGGNLVPASTEAPQHLAGVFLVL